MSPLSAQARIQRRAKQAERDSGKWLLEHDGIDPKWANIMSSTGRVGQITDLQFDVVSVHYAGEVKNIKMPARFLGFWKQIRAVAAIHNKQPVLIVQPSNADTVMSKSQMTMHILSPERHAVLLRKEREHDLHVGQLPISPDDVGEPIGYFDPPAEFPDYIV